VEIASPACPLAGVGSLWSTGHPAFSLLTLPSPSADEAERAAAVHPAGWKACSLSSCHCSRRGQRLPAGPCLAPCSWLGFPPSRSAAEAAAGHGGSEEILTVTGLASRSGLGESSLPRNRCAESAAGEKQEFLWGLAAFRSPPKEVTCPPVCGSSPPPKPLLNQGW